MNEAQSNKLIVEWLESIGAYAIKTIATTKAGTHDILGCWKGRFFSIEGKTPIGKASYLQEQRIREVHAAGGLAMIAHSLAEVKTAFHEWESSGWVYDYRPNLRKVLSVTL